MVKALVGPVGAPSKPTTTTVHASCIHACEAPGTVPPTPLELSLRQHDTGATARDCSRPQGDACLYRGWSRVGSGSWPDRILPSARHHPPVLVSCMVNLVAGAALLMETRPRRGLESRLPCLPHRRAGGRHHRGLYDGHSFPGSCRG